MWAQMQSYLDSWFHYTGVSADLIVIGIALAIGFGAVWLLAHWPPLFKQHWLWAVAVFSAFFTLLAVVFIQVPLRWWIGEGITSYWDNQTIYDWLLLVGLPQLIISGLVQEGAKMVPMVAWWWRAGKTITPRMGLAIGALAGAGFGIFEAASAHNQLFELGWTWSLVGSQGLTALAGFWERFWIVGFHISVSALVGYGLAKGKGWQFYLIAAALHTLVNFVALPYAKGQLNVNQVEICVAVVAFVVTAVLMWLRWQETRPGPETPPAPDEPAAAGTE